MGSVCAIYKPGKNCVFNLLRATQRLQHLGQEWSGIAVSNGSSINYVVKPGTIREGFPLNKIANRIGDDYVPKENYEGSAGIGCTSVAEKQPMCLHANFGQFALAFDGRVLNLKELKDWLKDKGHVFYRGNETEVLMKLIAQGTDVVEGIKIMNEKVRGSYSIAILQNGCVYVVRDPRGVNPLQIGEGNGNFIAVSETDALNRTGSKFIRDMKPGEIIRLSEKGIETVGQLPAQQKAFCAFRWFYTARVDAILEGISSDLVRKKIGAWHFDQDAKEGIKLDMIAGMPMSGTSYALGYSEASIDSKDTSKIVPFNEAFLYDRYSGRSYIPPTQEERNIVADQKVSIMANTVKGKVVGLTDDSIVRGTVMMYKIHLLKEAGAKEVHVRIGYPMLKDICLLNISTKEKDELAIYKFKDLEGIRKHIGADSLRYTPIDIAVDMLNESAITPRVKLTKDDLCLFCTNSVDPIETPENR